MFLKSSIPFYTGDGAYERSDARQFGILIEREALLADANADALNACCSALAAKAEREAREIGADAVFGVDFRTEFAGDRLIVTLLGNAVRLNQGEANDVFAESAAEETPDAPLEEAAVQTDESEADTAFDPLSAEYGEAWRCAECGVENDCAFVYCPKCGSRRNRPWKCRQCGQENLDEYKFCPVCGSLRDPNEALLFPNAE